MHLFLVHLDSILVPAHSPVVLRLHLLHLLVRELDLLLHQGLLLLKVNVLVIQLVFLLLESPLELRVLGHQLSSIILKVFFVLTCLFVL